MRQIVNSLCVFAPLRETKRNALLTKRKFELALGIVFLCFTSALAQSPSVTKVDPPSWWAKHSINPVRLLVRGSNLRGARVRSLNPELRVSEVSVNERGTYLFVDVE